MRNVMVRAWEIAGAAVKRFGGTVREYFTQALAMAWAEAKAPKCAEVELAADTRKFRTWIAKITGTHPVYKLDRKFLNQDTADEYGTKIFYLNDGAYEFNNGRRRGFFFVRQGQCVDATQADVMATLV